MGAGEFELESIQDRPSIRRWIHSVVSGMESGNIMFSSDRESVTLMPLDRMRLTIKSRKKKHKSKLTIKLSWNDENNPPSSPIAKDTGSDPDRGS